MRCVNRWADTKTVQMWQWAFATLCNFVLTDDGAAWSSASLSIKVSLLPVDCAEVNREVKVKVAQHLVSIIKLFSASLTDSSSDVIVEILWRISEYLITIIKSVDVKNLLVSSFDNSWLESLEKIDGLFEHTKLSTQNVLALKEASSRLARVTVIQESADGRLNRAIRTVSSAPSGSDDSINVLLSRLEQEFFPNIIECLLDPLVSLKSTDTIRLVRLVPSTSENEAAQLRKLIFKSFIGWSLETQDEFRLQCHQLGCALIDSNFHRFQTETMNKMSLNKDDEVTRDLSLLCLQSPFTTIDALVVYASECGQCSTIAEILSHLKSSCTYVDAEPTCILVTCLKKILEENVQPNQAQNFLTLLSELINYDVLPMSDFLSECVYPYTAPSPKLTRTMKICQTIWATVTDNSISIHMKPVPLLALLVNSLHHCMLIDLATVEYDIHILKRETLAVLRIIMKKIMKNIALNQNDVHWLWTKQLRLHKIAHFTLHPLFVLYGLEKGKLSYEHLLLDHSLVALSLSRPNQEIDTSLLLPINADLNLIPKLVIALSKVLPRLIMEEISNLIENMSKCIADYLLSLINTEEKGIRLKSKITTILIFMNSLICLCDRPSHSNSVCTSHFIQTVHFCGTAIRNVVSKEPDMSIPALTTLSYVAGRLTEFFPDESRAVGRLLILDLLNQIPNLLADSAVNAPHSALNVLKDFVEKPSNDELHVHISKLVDRFCNINE